MSSHAYPDDAGILATGSLVDPHMTSSLRGSRYVFPGFEDANQQATMLSNAYLTSQYTLSTVSSMESYYALQSRSQDNSQLIPAACVPALQTPYSTLLKIVCNDPIYGEPLARTDTTISGYGQFRDLGEHTNLDPSIYKLIDSCDGLIAKNDHRPAHILEAAAGNARPATRSSLEDPRRTWAQMLPIATSQPRESFTRLEGSQTLPIMEFHHHYIRHPSDTPWKLPCSLCGRCFRDHEAHMLTRRDERPEKCPVPTCKYRIRGFARKHDRDRHVMAHDKEAMTCLFCPGTIDSVEKSFRRVDAFKRHIASIHGVKKLSSEVWKKISLWSKSIRYGSSDLSKMCSICGSIFFDGESFYSHLNCCVNHALRDLA